MIFFTQNNANVAYNFQKVPGLVSADPAQAIAGLKITLRDDPTKNRNINFLFPVNQSTPNPGAGSPTLLSYTKTTIDNSTLYVGRQVY